MLRIPAICILLAGVWYLGPPRDARAAAAIADSFIDGRTAAWRYADSQGRWDKPLLRTVIAAGKPTRAAVMDLDVQGATLIFLAYHYRRLDVTEDLRLRIRYRFHGGGAPATRLALRLTSLPKGESDPRGGGKPRGTHVVEPSTEVDGWQTADLPVTQLGVPVGHQLYRVYVRAQRPADAEAGQLHVRDIALHAEAGPTATAARLEPPPARAGAITGPKLRAIYPKTLWNTDPKCRFSEDALRWVHSLGFNLIGPARGGADAVRMLGARARGIGLQIYGSMSPCYTVHRTRAGVEDKMVWFTGWEQDLACPASGKFWQEVIVKPCVEYAQVSREVPLVAVLIDWEIYARPKFRGAYGPCYCGACVDRYRAKTGSKLPALSPAKRFGWLREHDEVAAYDAAFYERIEELARGLRQAMDKENPQVSIFLIPWSSRFLETVARAVATEQAPVWVSNESTYGKASPSIPDDAAIAANVNMCLADRRRLDGLGIPYRYLAATYNGWGSPEFHGRALVRKVGQHDLGLLRAVLGRPGLVPRMLHEATVRPEALGHALVAIRSG